MMESITTENINIKLNNRSDLLQGSLTIPPKPIGLIVFAHGWGSSRLSPKNLQISKVFQAQGYATLLFDLFTVLEERMDSVTGEYRDNIPFHASRVNLATNWVQTHPRLNNIPIGYFGEGSGGSAALLAATFYDTQDNIFAIVSRSGRLDLAGYHNLRLFNTPSLFIVSETDHEMLSYSRTAISQMTKCFEKELIAIPTALHQIPEKASIEQISYLSRVFFQSQLELYKERLASSDNSIKNTQPRNQYNPFPTATQYSNSFQIPSTAYCQSAISYPSISSSAFSSAPIPSCLLESLASNRLSSYRIAQSVKPNTTTSSTVPPTNPATVAASSSIVDTSPQSPSSTPVVDTKPSSHRNDIGVASQ